MKKFIITLAASGLLGFLAYSQSDVDALRYSRLNIGGTARFMSMGGAFSALGADFTTLSTNPGGLGLYKKSEFSITPSFYTGLTKSSYNGSKSDDIQYNFNLGNVGLVITSQPKNKSKSVFRNFQFALGLNRLNNFNNRMLMEGYNSENSLIDTYVESANGIYYGEIEDDIYGFYSYDLNPAWYTYLIDTIPGFDDQYYGAIPAGGGIYQRKEIETWGSMNEFVLSLGANISEKVYLGGTFGFPFIRYFEKSTYSETDLDNIHDDFDNLRLYDDLQTHGAGFNMKFGAIVRATDWFRIGGAIHSPTWFNNMTDDWYSELTTEFDNGDYFKSTSPYGTYDYQIHTPWRALGGVSFIIGKRALISADYEFVDYSMAKLRATQYNFYDENNAIKTKYKETHNIRLGSEVRFGQFAVRAGYNYNSSPFTNNINDGARSYYSGGVGYRDKDFFVDFAYVRSVSHEDYYFYGTEDINVNPVKNDLISNNFLLTVGFRY
ncbi:MAG: hypothetical protein JW731_17180 [Bacteroidales bacterium]|nr:hypothetical protein [Bacteroidales bacterium]